MSIPLPQFKPTPKLHESNFWLYLVFPVITGSIGWFFDSATPVIHWLILGMIISAAVTIQLCIFRCAVYLSDSLHDVEIVVNGVKYWVEMNWYAMEGGRKAPDAGSGAPNFSQGDRSASPPPAGERQE